MSQIYRTEDLIQILAEERQACLSGRRLNLKVSPSGSPFLDMFLTTDGLQKFTAYSDFRSTVHRYQQEHQVSGIVWQTLLIQGKTLHYPRVHDQLIGLPEDLVLLRSTRDTVFEFWQEITSGLDLYLSLHGGKTYEAIEPAMVEQLWRRSEWASLCQQGKAQSWELILQLGWGQPADAIYRAGFPESGSEMVHAVHPGHRPIG